MKFSIITPNFNGGQYIEKCIESVLNQNVEFEHIIVDGASSDSSLELINKYPHLIVISEKDSGMYDAINKGIALATGDIISYLNSDDRYSYNSLCTVLESFKNNIKIDYVYGNCQFIDSYEEKIYIYRVPPLLKSLLPKISVIPWAQPSVFYKKKCFSYSRSF